MSYCVLRRATASSRPEVMSNEIVDTLVVGGGQYRHE